MTRNAIVLAFFLAIRILWSTPGPAQEIKSRRDAFGHDQAIEVEILLHSLFPDAIVQWDPVLAIRRSGRVTPVDLGNYTSRREEDGSVRGVALMELGTAKPDYIGKLKEFRASDEQTFPSSIVAFHIAPTGAIETKKVSLDPNDSLTRIAWFEVKSYAGEWPVLQLRYESYFVEPDKLTILEWDSLFDVGTGSFLGRIPAGAVVLHKNGESKQRIFSVRRAGPANVEIVDKSTGQVNHYPCGASCVVDRKTFLALLPR